MTELCLEKISLFTVHRRRKLSFISVGSFPTEAKTTEELTLKLELAPLSPPCQFLVNSHIEESEVYFHF